MERRWFFPAVAGSVFFCYCWQRWWWWNGGGSSDSSCFLLLLLLLARQALPFSSSSSAGWEEGDELRRDGGGVWQCWCSWRVTAAAPPPGVVVAAGMEEKMRSVWGSVDREGCFGCREEMAERGEWPGGGLFFGCSLSFSFQKHASPFSFPAPSRSTKLSSF